MSDMKTYDVETAFIFKGTFSVQAESKEEARYIIENYCGLVGGRIHSQLERDAVDWHFNIHPEKVLKRVRLKK